MIQAPEAQAANPIPTQPVTPPTAAPETPPASAPAAEPVAPEQDPRFASKFAALSKREQAARALEASIKAREAEYKAWQDQSKLADTDPLEFMKSKGWTFDKLTQLALNNGKKPAEMRLQELEDRLTKEKEAEKAAEEEAQMRSLEEKRTAFLGKAKEFLESNKEKYEITANEEEGPELIHNVMLANFEEHGKRLSFDEAAAMVEKHFEDIIDSKYAKLNKVKSKFVPKEPAPEAGKEAASRAQSPTLTNNQAATVATPAEAKALSIEESKQHAARLLRWT